MKNKIFKYDFFLMFSYIIFIITPIICYILIEQFNLFTDPLTKFGLSENSSYLWIFISLFFNLFLYVNSKIILKRQNIKQKFLSIILFFSLINLFISTIFIQYNTIHSLTAFIYFLTYPFFIFTYGFFIKKNNPNVGLFSIGMSSLCLVLPITTLGIFKGFAIPEITHCLLVLFWNIKLIYTRNNVI
jgi:hypothetical protein